MDMCSAVIFLQQKDLTSIWHCWVSEALWCFDKSKWMLPLIFPVYNLFNREIHAASEIRKHYSVEARVLFNSFVFLILVLYFTCQCLHYILYFLWKKKLNKSWQFDFPFIKLIFSLLLLALKSLVAIGTWRSSTPSITPTFILQCIDLPSVDQIAQNVYSENSGKKPLENPVRVSLILWKNQAQWELLSVSALCLKESFWVHVTFLD